MNNENKRAAEANQLEKTLNTPPPRTCRWQFCLSGLAATPSLVFGTGGRVGGISQEGGGAGRGGWVAGREGFLWLNFKSQKCSNPDLVETR